MTLRGAKEGTSVVHDWPHARIVVWSLRMIGLAGKQDRRIDLYRVHVLGARTQSGRHILSTACANHDHTQTKSARPLNEKENPYYQAPPEPHRRRRPQQAIERHQ